MSDRIDYRKIYKQFYGDIPTDDNGTRYDIHHIDGDRNNNSPDNLKAVSIDEHYAIHYRQGDLDACCAILIRMKNNNKLLSEISRERELKKLEQGTHKFQDSVWQKEKAKKTKEAGSNPAYDPEWQKLKYQKQKEEGRIKLWSSSYLVEAAKLETHPSKFKWVCKHCNKIGLGKGNYTRFHGDNCKKRTQ